MCTIPTTGLTTPLILNVLTYDLYRIYPFPRHPTCISTEQRRVSELEPALGSTRRAGVRQLPCCLTCPRGSPPLQRSSLRALLAAHPSLSPDKHHPVHSLMVGAEKAEAGGKESQPLKIDPGWYVQRQRSLRSLTADDPQFSRCPQNLLPTHQDQRSPPRFLYDLQQGGDRV